MWFHNCIQIAPTQVINLQQSTKQPSNQASNQTINQPTINRPNLPPLNIIGKKKCKFNKLMTINFICYCWKKKKRNWHFVVVYSTNQLKAHYIRTLLLLTYSNDTNNKNNRMRMRMKQQRNKKKKNMLYFYLGEYNLQ